MTLRPGASPLLDQTDRPAARDRIHARQRLIEDQQLGVVRKRLCHLHALPHAFAVGADFLVCGVGEIHRFERAHRGVARGPIVEAVQPHERRHPLEPGHPLVERVLLRAEADAEIQGRVLPDRLAEHGQLPLLGLSWPVISFMNVDLPAPFGPSSPVMPGGTVSGHVVQADDLAVPLRQVVGGRRLLMRTTSTPRTRRSRMPPPRQ